MRHVVRARHMELIPPRAPFFESDGRLNFFWEIEARNVDMVRRRTLRFQLVKNDEDKDPITLDDAAILHIPSNDEDPPADPRCNRALQPPVVWRESSSDSGDVPPGPPGQLRF